MHARKNNDLRNIRDDGYRKVCKPVSDLKSKLTTKLKDSKLEKNMKDYKEDTCFKLLSSVAQILGDVSLPNSEELDPEADESSKGDSIL